MRNFETIWSPTSDTPTIPDAPEAVLSTLTADGKRKWIYPTLSPGRFLKWRGVVAWALIALYLAFPIVRINGRPGILLDLLNREFTILGTTFYPTDTVLLMLLFIGTLVAIVLVTALLGRVWCGWACPQTVYMEFVFRPIERLFEGPEHRRKRRDEAPLDFDKLWRKSAKWGAFTLISLLLAHSLVAYFVGWESLLRWMTEPPTEHWGYFVMMAFTTGLILFDFGIFREQMCTIACPYARFQSVLLDPDSLIVSYDAGRGEPRGKAKKNGTSSNVGDCVDCFACVRTCPVGIDIREGLQMECIACTQCIDACDSIMDNLGRPRGLIRYTSENALSTGKARILRPRVALYGALMLLVSGLFIGALVARQPFDVEVVRAPGAPFMEMPDGQIANRLRIRVQNQTARADRLTLEPVAPTGAELRVVGTQPIEIDARALTRFEAWVSAPKEAFVRGETDAEIELRFESGEMVRRGFRLIGPE